MLIPSLSLRLVATELCTSAERIRQMIRALLAIGLVVIYITPEIPW
jgi:hypothetical protein